MGTKYKSNITDINAKRIMIKEPYFVIANTND